MMKHVSYTQIRYERTNTVNQCCKTNNNHGKIFHVFAAVFCLDKLLISISRINASIKLNFRLLAYL